MLSIEDLYKEIGKNIYIYPLEDIRILGNSIDLTASVYAWTTDGKYIFDEEKNAIIVPPHKTVCILTQEAVYVTSKIGGTYHSRVTLAKMGFGHIGTMLDPEYIGQSLIILHNTTDKEQIIKHKDRIVSLVFHYLHTPILVQSHNASPGHKEKLSSFNNFEKYNQWAEGNRWAFEKRELVDRFMTSEGYKEFKKKHKTDQWKWNSRLKNSLNNLKKNLKKYFILIIIFIIPYIIISNVLSLEVSDKVTIIGIIIAGLVGSISSDLNRG